MSTNKSEHAKKEYKSYADMHTWKVGHEVNLQLETLMQEYRDEVRLQPWCDELTQTLRDAMVQVMEGFYKYGNQEKLRRYEAALYYVHKAQYTLQLGQALGWWSAEEFLGQLDEFEKVLRQTRFHFVEKNGKNDDA
ncbi:hypothetical protein IJJ27_02010 [bacterium]|nr:hypothetical protein [bacterium]MBQ6436319.1 hypothetical protein [bacterium]